MDHLNDLVLKSLKQQLLKRDELIFRLIEDKLKIREIILTEEQKHRVKHQLQQDTLDRISIELTEGQVAKFKKLGLKNITLDLGNLDDKIQDAIVKATQSVLIFVRDSLIDGWKSQASSLLPQEKDNRLKFANLIEEIWGKPLTLLEILHSVSLQAGADFNNQFRSSAIKENDFVFEVLTRLHARGCQIVAEILTLLRNGFADGAHARWRTLYEISVIAQFIKEYGKDIAERYICHSVVTEYQRALQYQEHCEAIGYVPLTQDEINILKSKHDEMLKRFGKAFRYDYGWASCIFDDKKTTFTEIERHINFHHMRHFYKLANINIHSGSEGADFRLGSPPEENNEVLVAGPSIFGLGEPGQNTAYSIGVLTGTLLLTRPNLDRIAFTSSILKLRDEVIWAFDEVIEVE